VLLSSVVFQISAYIYISMSVSFMCSFVTLYIYIHIYIYTHTYIYGIFLILKGFNLKSFHCCMVNGKQNCKMNFIFPCLVIYFYSVIMGWP
jgi:hypothetical protein